ncbi:MAG TPA: hypothetical protein VFR97_11285 [Capillimicrobium sp.]|nr:hypothetical protein [Capillimicrobium sp.]
MAEPPSTRSVKIPADERGGWSSDRPGREPAAPRRFDPSVRGRVLRPTDRLRYVPGSLVVIASASRDARERFAARVVEDKPAILSIDKVRALLQGRVAADVLEEKAAELLAAAVAKRLGAGDGVILLTGVGEEERTRFVVPAAQARRPRHLILLEVGRDEVAEDDRPALNALRNALDAGELGDEGFHTALRLGGGAASEVKRIVFRPPPADD